MTMSDNRIDGLKQALQMEKDGKAYYEQARNKTDNQMGKKIFDYLMKAEESHIKKIKQLYESLEQTGTWPGMILRQDSEERVGNIFAEALGALEKQVRGTTDDIEALKLAADLETKGKKFYESRADATDDPFEKKFYLLLAYEESEHYISILDTIQFLEDPQAYYHQMEISRGFH
jgi:rubrerythrin